MAQVEVGHKVKQDKAEKVLAKTAGLLPGEDVWFYSKCNNMKPLTDVLAVTNARVVGLGNSKVSFAIAHQSIVELEPNEAKGTLTVGDGAGASMTFKMVAKEDFPRLLQLIEHGRVSPPPAEVVAGLQTAAAAASREDMAKQGEWPNTKLLGGKLTSKASSAIGRLRHGEEEPWLILVAPGGAGVLTAFADRLAIIKTGALTSLMAGSLGGERAATIYFRDITGLEYNSGMLSGVLEVLTASYSGSSNKDYWRGSTKGRNANADDPWTLSNTLPLNKAEYAAALPDLNELRSRISQSKQVVVNVAAPEQAPAAQSSFADEVGKLAALRDSGVLTDEEFAAAKARLISSM